MTNRTPNQLHASQVGPGEDLLERFRTENARLEAELKAKDKEIVGLREAIDVSLYAIKSLGAGGHAETPLLVLKPERGDNAVILATYMPHSGADTTLQYLQRECVRPMERALKGE